MGVWGTGFSGTRLACHTCLGVGGERLLLLNWWLIEVFESLINDLKRKLLFYVSCAKKENRPARIERNGSTERDFSSFFRLVLFA